MGVPVIVDKQFVKSPTADKYIEIISLHRRCTCGARKDAKVSVDYGASYIEYDPHWAAIEIN